MLQKSVESASDIEISNWVWDEKYRYYTNDGVSKEYSISDTHKRVVSGVYAKDKSKKHADTALELMNKYIWAPAGRIHAGAGTEKRVTLVNCYVSPTIQDSLDTIPELSGVGIMDGVKISALTQQMGGGIGMGFSPIRPDGALVKRTHSVSSGVLPFMEIWDATCATIKSAGHRRGALMGTLLISHPDAPKYIKYKQTQGRLTNFNISLLITDKFMQAVKNDDYFDLHFHVPRADSNHVGEFVDTDGVTQYIYDRVKAREMWNDLIKSTFDYSEPGIIFIDRINKNNNLWYCEHIEATNPCFTGDTKVWTAHGPKSFKWLVDNGVERIKVLTQLSDGTLAYRTMVNPRVTGRNKRLVEITLRASNRRKTITKFRCTLNHEIFLNNEESCRADELEIGDSIASVYRNKANSKNMSYLRNEIEQVLEHHVAAEVYNGRRPNYPEEHAHHKDGNRKNNKPSNIEIKNGSEHNSDHMKGENNPMVKFPEKNPFLYMDFSGKNNARYRHDIKTEEIVSLRNKGWTIRDIANKFDCSSYLINHRLGRIKGRVVNNHTVVDIKFVTEREDVYCGTVPSTGRFFIHTGKGKNEGILVHNCGEQPLPPNGACNLGGINLAELVNNPFTDKAKFNFELYTRAIHSGVRFLDNVLDVTLFPTKEQEIEAHNKRRIGLGVTALGNMLQFMKLVYGSEESLDLIKHVMVVHRNEAYRASIELAKERGPFPLFDRDKFLKGEFIKTLPEDIKEGIYENGIRNGVLLTIAPMGTVSMYYKNTSSGCEPTIARTYKRKTREADGSYREFKEISDYGYYKYKEITGHRDGDPLPDYMCSALVAPLVTVEQHIMVQATLQKYIDSSISKTVNCPSDMKFEDFKNVYELAYDLGCKGCTTYKPSDVRGSVISVEEKKPEKHEINQLFVEPRPEELQGFTYKVKYPGVEYAFYITINNYELNGKLHPFEIFVNTKSVTHHEWIVALTRMISAIFRRGGDVTFIVEELQQVFSPQGGAFVKKKYIPSLAAMIGTVIEEHFIKIGLINDSTNIVPVNTKVVTEITNQPTISGAVCPQCQAPTLIKSEGCEKCASCDYSKCG